MQEEGEREGGKEGGRKGGREERRETAGGRKGGREGGREGGWEGGGKQERICEREKPVYNPLIWRETREGRKGKRTVSTCTHLKMVLTLTTRAALSHSSQAMRSIRGTIRSSVL